MPNEKELSFGGGDINEEGLRSLDADLESLTIWDSALTNAQLAPLSRLTRLKTLVLGEMAIDDGLYHHLKNLRELTCLYLPYTNIEGDFAPLTGLPLRDVRLEGCRRVSDRCLSTLAAFPTLRHLEIHMTRVTDQGLRHLAGLPLETLWLGGLVTDDGMNTVGTMTALKHLDVCAPRVTDQGVRNISALTGLEVLWLAQCGITDASVDRIAQFQSLRELAVGKTRITAAGKARLQELLPQCRIVQENAP